METNNPRSPASAKILGRELSGDSFREFLQKLGVKDEYAGSRMKDLAGKVGFLGTLGAIILSIVLWNKATDILGFLIGLIVLGLGITVSVALAEFLRSYGDMLNLSVEQMRIIKKLEARRAAELAFWGTAKKPEPPLEAPDQAEIQAETVTEETDETNSAALLPEEPTQRYNSMAVEASPGIAGKVDRAARIAHFATRAQTDVICPICGKKLHKDYNACFYCGCKFIYDDEEQSLSNKKALERLRQLTET